MDTAPDATEADALVDAAPDAIEAAALVDAAPYATETAGLMDAAEEDAAEAIFNRIQHDISLIYHHRIYTPLFHS